MRNIPFKILCLLVIVSSSGCTTTYKPDISISRPTTMVENANPSLKITVTTDKLIYSTSDEIWVTVQLQNTSTQSFLINSRLAINNSGAPSLMREVTLVITDESGQIQPFRAAVNIGLPKPKHFSTLKPEAQIEEKYDLRMYFGSLPAGKYQIAAIYENSMELQEQTTWTGKIEAEVITFTITE